MPAESVIGGPVIALVAGEASGDQLGGALIRELRAALPGARFVGIGGERMRAEGLEAWWGVEELSVMGLAEVLSHLPRLLRLRRQLKKRLLALRPDVFIGVDAPDFNLGLERSLKGAGLQTIHYVSPSVWAWRRGRVKKIAASAGLVLCLFPFEPEIYAGQGVAARYTGHPMADEIPFYPDAAEARARLGLDPGSPCVALLPGSRAGEVSRLGPPLLDAAGLLARREPGMQFVAPMASPRTRRQFEKLLKRHAGIRCTVSDGGARTALAAADLVICASGTAALEAMLTGRPMVVVYRLNALTYFLARRLGLLKSEHFSLPNALAGEELVPELEQDEVTGERIFTEAAGLLEDVARREALRARFRELHALLRRDAARAAANCVQSLLNR